MTGPETSQPDSSLYERAGGMPFFEALVGAFYDRVADDQVLLAIYPDADDFTGPRRRLTLFLAQYWGGPATYSAERGHPKLRMRHLRFPVGPEQRDHWLGHMRVAVGEATAGLDDPSIADELMAYFVQTAEHLRNDTGLPITSASYPSTRR